tara:strand:+ start:102 stop:491 length:390 start_codon:yes stop_codon:yes gene_type:complete
MSETNYVIYHRNNRTLQLTNHFDLDGDLDPNYIRLRNLALTGQFVDGKFISKYPKKFNWVIECAKTELSTYSKYDKRRCGICSGIFKDVMNDDYTITDFYAKNVVEIDDGEVHPLFYKIIKKFNGVKIS